MRSSGLRRFWRCLRRLSCLRRCCGLWRFVWLRLIISASTSAVIASAVSIITVIIPIVVIRRSRITAVLSIILTAFAAGNGTCQRAV